MLLFRNYHHEYQETSALDLGLRLTIRCSLYPSLAQHESQCQCCEIFHSWPIKKCSNTGVNPATRLTTQSTDARQVQQEWVRAVSGEGGNVALLRTVVLLCHKMQRWLLSMMPIVSFAPFELFSFSLSFLLFIHFFISASLLPALLLLQQFASATMERARRVPYCSLLLLQQICQRCRPTTERGEYRIGTAGRSIASWSSRGEMHMLSSHFSSVRF